MARPLRIEYPNAWYHVMNRGRRGEDVFSDKTDYEIFLAILRESTDMFGVRIAAYCLMPNHYHLLLQTPSANLSRVMRHVNESRNITIYLARKHSGLPLKEIGKEFGFEKYSSVSSIVSRTTTHLAQSKQMRRQVDGIIKQLGKSQAKT